MALIQIVTPRICFPSLFRDSWNQLPLLNFSGLLENMEFYNLLRHWRKESPQNNAIFCVVQTKPFICVQGRKERGDSSKLKEKSRE